MAYPASEILKVQAVEELDRGALRLKNAALLLKDESAVGPVEALKFDQFMSSLSRYIDRVAEIELISGIAAAINDQKPNFVGDPVAEAVAMRNSATSLRDWLFAALETVDVYGNTDEYGNRTPLTFSPAQTAQFRTNVDAFVATIG